MVSSYLALLKAAYDYTATSEDELSIKEDALYFLLDNSDPDWYKVRAKSDDDDEPSGLVPAAYLEDVEPILVAKALYDYAATADGELSITEDEALVVYEKDDDWWLVKSSSPGGKLGLVPGSYVEETEETSSPPSAPTPHEPSNDNHYHDPAELVAQSHAKAKADPIETWAVTEIDVKGKKKKGTLGIGNGNMFFASESDKTPVRQWPTSQITQSEAEKAKHLLFDINGDSLHINAGSQSTADAITSKLELSKAASAPTPPATPPAVASLRAASPEPVQAPVLKQKKSVNFAQAPEVIHTHEDEYDESGPEDDDTVVGTVLYDFAAEGEDELAVTEGESVTVVDRQGNDDWWKVRNAQGMEGVVPALYVQLPTEDESPTATSAAAARDAQAEAERQAKARAEEEAERRSAEDRRRSEEQQARAEEAKRKRIADEQAAETARADREAARKMQDEAKAVSPPAMPKRPPQSNGSKSSTPTQFPDKAKVRTWHDHTGQFRVDAQYLGTTSGNKLRLHKTNGVIIEVPIGKMSPADMTYVENFNKKDSPRSTSPEDDNIPLSRLPVVTERSPPSSSSPAQRAPPPRKKPQVDWFEFFLNAGCDVDDCTRYASAFDRDKIDEAILPDLEASTLRTLGLREGDIIRVIKHIGQKNPKGSTSGKAEQNAVNEQLRKDEELARELQARENGSKTRSGTASPAPNLFAGANGALKNQRRGRPQLEPKSSSSVGDMPTISAASTQMRTSSPQIKSPDSTIAPQPQAAVTAPARKSTVSGFEDDAWAPRPSSTQGIKSSTPRPNLATPTPTPPPAPPAPPIASMVAALPPVMPPPRPSTASGGAITSPPDIDLFAKIAQLRPPSAPIQSQPTGLRPSPSPQLSTPTGYHQGLGVGGSGVPMSQFITAQQTGALSPPTAPRGPFAPVPSNQSLLAPLVPTTTGFTGFVPTRPSPLNSQPTGFGQGAPSFISSQPTGFSTQPNNFPTHSIGIQPTGFQPSSNGFTPSLQPTPTGFAGQSGFGGSPFHSASPIGFQPTGFQPQAQPQFQQGGSVFDNLARAPPAPQPPTNDTSPANVFANMKAGGFGRDASTPQSSDKYDALRNPGQQPFLAPQQTGWGGQSPQPNFLPGQPTGFQPGFQPGGFQPNGFQPQPTGFQPGFQQPQQFGNGYR